MVHHILKKKKKQEKEQKRGRMMKLLERIRSLAWLLPIFEPTPGEVNVQRRITARSLHARIRDWAIWEIGLKRKKIKNTKTGSSDHLKSNKVYRRQTVHD